MTAMKQPKVLIVEDEPDIADILKMNLNADGFDVVLAEGSGVLDHVKQHPPHYLLDVMIPARWLRSLQRIKRRCRDQTHRSFLLPQKHWSTTSFLGLKLARMITLPSRLAYRWSYHALRPCCDAVRPMPQRQRPTKKISAAGITMDTTRMVVKTADHKINLNATEFALLKYLISKPGWVFKRTQLMEACKGDDVFVTDRSIDVMMVAIRKKLGPMPI